MPCPPTYSLLPSTQIYINKCPFTTPTYVRTYVCTWPSPEQATPPLMCTWTRTMGTPLACEASHAFALIMRINWQRTIAPGFSSSLCSCSYSYWPLHSPLRIDLTGVSFSAKRAFISFGFCLTWAWAPSFFSSSYCSMLSVWALFLELPLPTPCCDWPHSIFLPAFNL